MKKLFIFLIYLIWNVNCINTNLTNTNITTNQLTKSSTSTNHTTNIDVQRRLEHVRDLIALYYLPTIVIIGLIGNTLTIIILSKEKTLLKLHESKKTIANLDKYSSNYQSVNQLNTNKNSIKSHTQINLQMRKKAFTPKKPSNQFSSSNYFIFCLAVSDLMYNFVLLLVWISRVSYNLVHIKYICQVTIAITYICSFLSAAFTTLFTFQRFMAVLRPLKSATNFSLQSPNFIKKLICALVIFSLLVYSYSLFLYDTEPKKDHDQTEAFSKCGPKENSKNLLLIIDNTVDTLLTLIIPSFGIMFMNVAICRSFSNYQKENLFNDKSKTQNSLKEKSKFSAEESIVFKETSLIDEETSKTRRNTICSDAEVDELKKVTQSTNYLGLPIKDMNEINNSNHNNSNNQNINHTNSTNSAHNKNKVSHQVASSRHVTKTLLIVSFAFILLNSPFRASQLFSYIRMFITKNYVYSNFEFAINEVLLNLYFTSYSVNFFLYSLCGRKFRDSLKALVCFGVCFLFNKISRLFNYLYDSMFRKTNNNNNTTTK